MKRFFFLLLIIATIVALSLPQTWNYFNSFFSNNTSQNSQLSFKSLFGEYAIYIDGKEIGIVGDKKIEVFPRISSGERTIRIVRKSDPVGFYYVLERKINFLSGSQVEIEWESGPSVDSSNGVIRYFSEAVSRDGTELLIIPFPPNADVQINGNLDPDRKVILNDSKLVKVNISASENYENQEVTIELSNARKDIRHTVEIYLYKKPFVN